MRMLAVPMGLLVALSALPVMAERPYYSQYRSTISASDVTATPEMWLYEREMENYLNPEMARRQRAEFRANQRLRRMASMEWFGFSNARPRMSPDPIHGDYTASWTSGSTLTPKRWSGSSGRPWVIIGGGSSGLPRTY